WCGLGTVRPRRRREPDNRDKRGGRIHDANSWPVFSSGGSGIEELGIAVVRPTLDLFLKFEQLAGSAVRAACDPPVRSKKVQCFKNLLFRDIGLSGLATRSFIEPNMRDSSALAAGWRTSLCLEACRGRTDSSS